MNKFTQKSCAYSAHPTQNPIDSLLAMKAEATRPKTLIDDGCPYVSGALRLKLSLNRTAEKALYLKGVLFDSSMRELADCEAHCPKGRDYITLRFHSKQCYLPGDYRTVVLREDEPFALVTFHYEGNATTACTLHPLTTDDLPYRVATTLRNDYPYEYAALQSTSGIAHLREALMARVLGSNFNKLCEQYDMKHMRRSLYFVVSGGTRKQAYTFADLLTNLVEFSKESNDAMGCHEWAKQLSEASEDDPALGIEDLEEHAYTLTDIGVLSEEKGKAVLSILEKAVNDLNHYHLLTLMGTADEAERLLQASPTLAAAIPEENRFHIERADVADQWHNIQWPLEAHNVLLTPRAEQRLVEQLMKLDAAGSSPLFDENEGYRYIKRSPVAALRQRLMKQHATGAVLTETQMRSLLPEDIDLPAYLDRPEPEEQPATAPTEEPRDEFAESMEKLNDMVGLNNLKEHLTDTFLLMRFNEARRRLGLQADETGTFHMIFTGNPGTGKSTVAALMGRILHSLGVLSKGNVICTERHTLVKRYIGETEEAMNELLKQAKGNVLFIDEAYTLCVTEEDRRDFGHHVIESLLGVLAQPHPDMVVILAGYEKEMERMMEMNPGLKGRFPYRFNFDDYNAEELHEIAMRHLEQHDYTLTDDARELLDACIATALERKDRHFANARWMLQFLTAGVLPSLARRLMTGAKLLDAEMCRTIHAIDIEAAAAKHLPQEVALQKPRRVIGFRA